MKKILTVISVMAFVIITGTIITVGTMYNLGCNSIQKTTGQVVQGCNMDGADLNQTIMYQGSEYIYKKGIVNILVLGVDNEHGMSDNVTPGELGQADAIYLVSIDTYNDQIHIMGIPRDTMTSIQIMDEDNKYFNMQTFQITLQYAYGDNCKSGSKLMAKAVSPLLYDIPISRVCVVNLNAVQVLNDAVGGVTVKVEEDFTDESGEVVDPDFYKGNTVTLHGKQALLFVRERDCSIFASSMTRVSRQEQYIDAFVDEAKRKLKTNKLLAFEIYNKLLKEDYIYTDLTKSECVYLGLQASKMSFSKDNIVTVSGMMKKGDRFEEYYVDPDALKQQVIDMFYHKIDN